MAHAAVISAETFDANAAGWSGRDGDMAFSHQPGFIQGSFGASALPLNDAFRVSTGNFVGDYLSEGATGWIFNFNSVNFAPANLSIRFAGNGEFFFQQLSAAGGSQTYNVALSYSGDWFGTGGATEFNTALQNVDYVEIQFAMQGTGAQTYQLHSFELSGDPMSGGGGGTGAIPEPGTSLFLVGGLIIFSLRRWTTWAGPAVQAA